MRRRPPGPSTPQPPWARRRIPVALVLGALATAGCGQADPPAPGAPPGARIAAITGGVQGFRIATGGDNSFQVNAFGGAIDGGPVKLWQNCPVNNMDCTWTYKNGTILSDTNPLIGIRTSDHRSTASHCSRAHAAAPVRRRHPVAGSITTADSTARPRL